MMVTLIESLEVDIYIRLGWMADNIAMEGVAIQVVGRVCKYDRNNGYSNAKVCELTVVQAIGAFTRAGGKLYPHVIIENALRPIDDQQ
jgi:hypothetical protein